MLQLYTLQSWYTLQRREEEKDDRLADRKKRGENEGEEKEIKREELKSGRKERKKGGKKGRAIGGNEARNNERNHK